MAKCNFDRKLFPKGHYQLDILYIIHCIRLIDYLFSEKSHVSHYACANAKGQEIFESLLLNAWNLSVKLVFSSL